MYSWADVIGFDAFLGGIEDEELRAETRQKTVDMFNLVDRGGCRHRAITAYFDESIEPCGLSCDLCRGTGIESLVATAVGSPGSRRIPSGRGRAAAGALAIGPTRSPRIPNCSSACAPCASGSPTPRASPPTSSSAMPC
jgi:hypothetical protein